MIATSVKQDLPPLPVCLSVLLRIRLHKTLWTDFAKTKYIHKIKSMSLFLSTFQDARLFFLQLWNKMEYVTYDGQATHMHVQSYSYKKQQTAQKYKSGCYSHVVFVHRFISDPTHVDSQRAIRNWSQAFANALFLHPILQDIFIWIFAID